MGFNALNNLINLFYPQLCFACERTQAPKGKSICITCEFKIAPTGFHLLEDNPVLQRFWGRIALEHASTCYEFNKGGLLQNLIHQLKYDNKPNIGVELGKMYGAMLKDTPPYNSIDYVIPVPLHPKKQHQRGYNQAAVFAQGLAESMEIEWSEDFLLRVDYTETQTKKSRLDRFANVQNAFKIAHPEKIKGKHLLLVDDIITTGATLEACAIQLLEVEGVKVSLAAIALAN